mgnify:FL=1
MTDNDQYTPIPYEQLSKDALNGVIDEFINREGTDYGWQEFSLEDKHRQVMLRIQRGHALIVFDHDGQSVSIMLKEQLETLL